MSEMLLCPFCGGEGIIWPFREHPFYVAICKDGCGCQLGDFKTREEAIEAWNTRAERTCQIKQHRCMNCDHEINDKAYFVSVDLGDGFWTADSRRANYCPNCGAKVIYDD